MRRFINLLSSRISRAKAAREAEERSPKVARTDPPQTIREILELEVAGATIFKILAIALLFWVGIQLFVQLQTIVIITAISFFVAVGMAPIVEKLERYTYRPVAILIIYALFFGALGILFVKIIPIVSSQLWQIANDARQALTDVNNHNSALSSMLTWLQFDPQQIQVFVTQNLSSLSRNLQSIAGSTFSILTDIFQGVFNLLFSLVLIFFILLEREKITAFLLSLLSLSQQKYVQEKSILIQAKIAKWLRGQVILMVSMGSFMYLGMKIFEWTLDMKYAATIALLSAFMELVPYLGVFITGLLCVLIAINISWVLVVSVLVWIAIAQFLEGNMLVPIVMEKVTGLSSVAVILALSVGGILGNAAGGMAMAIIAMILAVPIATIISIFIHDVVKQTHQS